MFTQRLPESVTIDEGIPAQMVARMAGTPQPMVNWLKDGQPLRPSDRIFTAVEVRSCLVFFPELKFTLGIKL